MSDNASPGARPRAWSPIAVAAATAALLTFLSLPAPPVAAQVPAVDPEPVCAKEGAGAPTGGNTGPLRVATFNVLHSQTDEGEATLEARLPLQVTTMVNAGVEIVGLQEAAFTTNHGRVAQRLAQGLAAATGQAWSWCWFQSNPHVPGEPDVQPGGGGGPLTEAISARVRAGEARWSEGLGVLSRYPIEEATVRRMAPRSYEAAACVPPDPIGCNATAFFDSRAVLRARVVTPGGAVDMFSTHLAHDLTPLSDDVTRLAQVHQAIAYIDETATADATPDFLVGDFNTLEGSAPYDALTAAGFIDTFRQFRANAAGFTSHQLIRDPGPTVDHRIDYVFARPGTCGLSVLNSTTFANAPSPYQGGWLWPSDHHAVVSTAACQTRSGGAGTGPSAPGVESRRDMLPATGGAGVPFIAGVIAALALVLRRRRDG